jgi:NAD(P)-dependent dehydrogenase (short-subunit alcohol dehydrogenase family)
VPKIIVSRARGTLVTFFAERRLSVDRLKAALIMLTLKLALELRGTGILVNAVCPGWVRTRMGGPAAPVSPEQGTDTPIWLATLRIAGPWAVLSKSPADLVVRSRQDRRGVALDNWGPAGTQRTGSES